MSHEIARTSYLSWVPSIFRVRGESSEGVSYFRLALGVAVFAGGFFVIRKLFSTNASIKPKTTTDRTDEENPLVVDVPKHPKSPPINPDQVEQVEVRVDLSGEHREIEKKARKSDSDDNTSPPLSPRNERKKAVPVKGGEEDHLASSSSEKKDTSLNSGDMDDLLVDEVDHHSSHKDPPLLIGTPVGTPVASPVKPDGRSPSQVINVVDFMQPTFSSKKSDDDDDFSE